MEFILNQKIRIGELMICPSEQKVHYSEKDCYHTIEITISRIRKKLKECTGRKDFIVTINGRGYKFKK